MKVSPSYMINLKERIEDALWAKYEKSKYLKVCSYMKQWQEEYEVSWGHYETNFDIVYKEDKNIDLFRTLEGIKDDELIIKIAIDLGLRWVLPDFVENQIIDVKDSLLRGGLKEGIDKAINSAVELGKSVTGIFTGKFENVSQAQNAVKNGGIIDGISDVLDSTLSFTTKQGWIPSNVASLISQGKDVILDNVSNNIEDEFVSQLDHIEKLGKYENNWREYYNAQDFEGMEREYQKIRERLKETLPLETTLKQAREIENLHLIIKNNGHNFNLTQEQLELAGFLVN